MYTGSRLEDSSGAFHRACLPSTSHLSRWGGGHDKACQVSGRRGTTWCSCGLDGIWSKDGNSSWDSTNQNGEEKGDLSTNRNGDEWLLVWSFSGNMGDEDGWMKHDDMIIHEVKPTINGETNWQLNLAMAAMEYPPLLIDIWSYQLDHSFRSRLLNGGFNQNIWFWVGFIDITIENCQQKGIGFFKKTGGVSPAKMWHFIQNQQQRGTCLWAEWYCHRFPRCFSFFYNCQWGYGHESKPWHFFNHEIDVSWMGHMMCL